MALKRLIPLVVVLVVAAGCAKKSLDIPNGSQVTVHKSDGTVVSGRLVDARSNRVVIEQANGDRAAIERANITSLRADDIASSPVGTTGDTSSNPLTKLLGGERYRDVTIPAGTVLPVSLETAVGSDISRPEETVHARLREQVIVDGLDALPAGTDVAGHVVSVERPGRVAGRGVIAMRFDQLDTPGAGTTRIETATISHEAPGSQKKDAVEVLAPAAAGAVLGRLVGGKKAGREAALVGGAAGAGYVLSTRGNDVRVNRGAALSVRLTAPVTFRVKVKS